MSNKPKFIHQPGIDQARRRSSTADEDVLAGLLLETALAALSGWPK
jgi:hypothetical protein